MKTQGGNDIVTILKMVKTILSEQEIGAKQASMAIKPEFQKKPTKVKFDSSTENPFEVIFSARGFSVDGTRMSFEELETAISKNYNLVLGGGQGVTLDAVKMQKILKYKELY